MKTLISWIIAILTATIIIFMGALMGFGLCLIKDTRCKIFMLSSAILPITLIYIAYQNKWNMTIKRTLLILAIIIPIALAIDNGIFDIKNENLMFNIHYN